MRKVVFLFAGRFVCRRHGHFIDWFVRSGFRVSVFGIPRGRWDLSGLEDWEASDFDLGWCLMRNKGPSGPFRPQIVICCNWILLPIACMLKFFFGSKLMYDEQDFPEIMFKAMHKSTRARMMTAAARILKRLFIPYCDLVTCIQLKDHICQTNLLQYNTNVIELHNYPSALWQTDGDGADAQTTDSSEEPLTFVYLGKVVDRKGCRTCGEAFVQATEQSPRFRNAELHFFAFEYGPPDLIDWLKSQRGIFVHVGLPPKEIVGFLQHRRSVGLLLYEKSPYYDHIGTNSAKAYEYLAMGAAVIATPAGDLGRFITDYDVGFLINGGFSTDELATVFVRISENPAEVSRKQRNAKALMSQESMRWEAVWDKVLKTGFFDENGKGARKLAHTNARSNQ